MTKINDVSVFINFVLSIVFLQLWSLVFYLFTNPKQFFCHSFRLQLNFKWSYEANELPCIWLAAVVNFNCMIFQRRQRFVTQGCNGRPPELPDEEDPAGIGKGATAANVWAECVPFSCWKICRIHDIQQTIRVNAWSVCPCELIYHILIVF